METARRGLAVWRYPSRGTPAWLFRRGRQRRRAVRQRIEISDHIGALAVLLDAGKAHRGPRNEALRIVDELVEVVDGPGAALALHRGREVEVAPLALLVADDAIEVRADAILVALREGVTGLALLGRGGALFDGGSLQQLLDWLGRCGRGFLGAPPDHGLHGDLETRFFRQLGRKQRVG